MGIKLKDCDGARALLLAKEINKVRCWLTGFHAGRGEAHQIAGEDALRQIEGILKDSVSE